MENSHQKRMQKILSIAAAQELNGAGHLTDQTIRHFHLEYNTRFLEYNQTSLPSSFNVAGSFFFYSPDLKVFLILEEKNNLFSFPDFVDWYTSPDQSFEYHDALDNMEEGVIYTFDNLIDPADLLYDIENGGEIAVSGFAIVRFGTEVSVMCIGGEETDIEKKNREIAKIFPYYQPAKFRSHIKSDPSKALEAVTLDSKLPLWKLLALTRFDTEDMSQSVRYLFHDIGNSFFTVTDNPASLFDPEGNPLWNNSPIEVQYSYQAEKIKEYNALFDLCASALFLPLYFDIHADDVVIERYKTNYDKESRKTSFQKIKKIPIKQRITYRNVNILRGQNNERDCRETI